jgi:hypothetical protein
VDDPLTVSKKPTETVEGVGVAESVTFTVNWKVPVDVGVPEMVALGDAEFSVRPAGSAEPAARLHVYGRSPPVAVSCVLYAELSVAPGSGLVVVMLTPAALIVIEYVIFWITAGCSESFTSMMMLFVVPAAVGVPEIVAFVEFEAKLRPAGSALEDASKLNVYGETPPVAVMFTL